MKAQYQIFKNAKGFYFKLVAANGEQVGGSNNEYYPTKAGCKQGIVDHFATVLATRKDISKADEALLQSAAGRRDILKGTRIIDKTK